MHIRVIEPPKPVLDLERVKQHLKVEDDDENDLIAGYLAAATGWLDGPGGWLGRCLGEQTLELVDCAFGNDRLPFPPAISVVSIVYADAGGTEQTLASDAYRLLANGSIWAATWPSVGSGPDAVRIRYRAGYPDRTIPAPELGGEETTVSGVPEPIRQAILLLVGQWYKSRENVVTGTIATALPFAAEALLATYRVWR